MRITIVLVGVVFAFACSKSKVDQALDDLGDLKDRMCKCEDAKCAKEVHAEYDKLGDKYKETFTKEAEKELPKDKRDKVDELDKEYKKCRREAKGKGKGNDGHFDEAYAKMTELKDKMCACKDKACADTVVEAMTAWSQEMKDAGNGIPSPTAEQAKKMADVTKQMAECSLTAKMK